MRENTRYKEYKRIETELVLDKLTEIGRLHDEITKDLEHPTYYNYVKMLPEEFKIELFTVDSTTEQEVSWSVILPDGKRERGKLPAFLLKSTEHMTKVHLLSELKRGNDSAYTTTSKIKETITAQIEKLQQDLETVNDKLSKLIPDSHKIQEMIILEKNKD